MSGPVPEVRRRRRRIVSALPDPVLGQLMIGVAALGVIAAVVGTVVGWRLLTTAGTALGRSLELTTDTLDALDTSIDLASSTLDVVGGTLADVEATAGALEETLADSGDLLGETADLAREDVAGSLESVEGALPALIQVAGTIDTTLRALSTLPFGPEYDPEEPFDRSLVRVQESLVGLPGELRRQGDLIDAAAANLEGVGAGVEGLVSGLADLDQGLQDALGLLADYRGTAQQGRDVVQASADEVQRQVVAARIALVLFGFAFAGLQTVPYHLGRRAVEAAAAATLDPPPG